MVTFGIWRRRCELRHAHVPGVEAGHQPLDRPALARSVPTLEQDAQRRAEPTVADEAAEDETKVQQPELSPLEPLGLLPTRQLQAEVELLEDAVSADAGRHSGSRR